MRPDTSGCGGTKAGRPATNIGGAPAPAAGTRYGHLSKPGTIRQRHLSTDVAGRPCVLNEDQNQCGMLRGNASNLGSCNSLTIFSSLSTRSWSSWRLPRLRQNLLQHDAINCEQLVLLRIQKPSITARGVIEDHAAGLPFAVISLML
jgi:hypothetical protein